MRRRKAFTMIELIFVIVVIGIIAKFGVEFLIQAYNGYIFSAVQNKLQTQTETALEQITNRLQYRIKSSIIARLNDGVPAHYVALADANGSQTILEWVGYDIDGLRGNWDAGMNMNIPTWSGFIDLNNANTDATHLVSLGTNTANAATMIQALSGNPALGIAQTALFFIGGNSDINKFGWAGTVINDQNSSMHAITSGAGNVFTTPSFTGYDVYEYYQLAWTAYALVWNGTNASHNTAYTPTLDGGAGSTSLFGTVLPTPLKSGTTNGQWREDTNNTYTVKADNQDVVFTYNPADGSFTCDTTNALTGQICKRLAK